MTDRRTIIWTFVITSFAAFMVSLDNLIVTMALPAIRLDLGASIEDLEWTVNAYTLTFGVFLLTGATLGERFGRRKMLAIGLTVFTLASAAAAISTTTDQLVAARAVQGLGGALILPLTLTILSAAVPAERRGAALGVWGAVTGLAVAAGPLVGGAIVEGGTWQWIFWINVPIGVVLVPLALFRLHQGRGHSTRLDLIGLALVSAGLLGVVLGLVRGNAEGWTSPTIVTSFVVGGALLVAFVLWELRTPQPMLPMRLFRLRTFAVSNSISLLFSFGMFGSIFLLSQYLQIVGGYSPLEAGVRTLPWTAMPLLVAPIAGPLSDKIGGRPFLIAGLFMQALGLFYIGITMSTSQSYASLVPAFIVSGVGMAFFFIPVANVVLGSVRPQEEGVASGTNNAIREIGGVFGVAVLASVFSAQGGYASPQTFVDGAAPAVIVGAGVVLIGAFGAILIPSRRATRRAAAERELLDLTTDTEPALSA
jgi:EmrB/QacA subfamily drug resistance transporter